MIQPGNRYFYVIGTASYWEGVDMDIIFITQNPAEAIDRFRWLYDVAIYEDFLTDDGDEGFENRYYNVSTADKEKISGYFEYTDDDRVIIYKLMYLKTHSFWSNLRRYETLDRRYEQDAIPRAVENILD